MSIAANIEKIEERIQKACDAGGRRRDGITLMAVSKFVPAGRVEQAYLAGIRCFGESRVKEAADKFAGFKEKYPDVTLNLIGSLQSNKAKTAALFFDCIQSVDRESIIGALEKHLGLREKPLDVLLELHTGEESKSGFSGIDELFRAADLVLESKLNPRGLMTMAPFSADRELVRSSFRRLAKAQRELQKRFPPEENWACLSMGMSNDFEIAVEEGSTMLRIGGAIFEEQ